MIPIQKKMKTVKMYMKLNMVIFLILINFGKKKDLKYLMQKFRMTITNLLMKKVLILIEVKLVLINII